MFKAGSAWILAGVMSLCLLANAAEPAPAPRQVAPPKRIPDVAPGVTPEIAQSTGEPVTTASMSRAVRQAVVADAASRFQVSEDAVVLSGAERVTWSDGSLGCPKPGRIYTQALVPGYRVTATTATGRMVYHTDEHGNVVTCGLSVRHATGAEPRTEPPVKAAPVR